ncbi:MAG: 4-hydroxy-3-methylbut-2-enyl diphosphate reductase [Candidatus Paraimprobicoccus trichonymphae]|uniref:4-hydroxy-3-methylbut-2-enyl diphosphate reductase n=1 Tax=Candidatus Paraimprobicoccus trichonymphae TaxID=3033793 RepID=A0AA48KZ59_9FIRM|nr:MAG: 4-hydroxy-3-methylbut-2-enyl diphosphate reductase [Candidatus Paraimprobicoccus trichonymphae]
MEFCISKNFGFCFGVNLAVKSAYEESENNNLLYSYGEVVHNNIVIKNLLKKNVKIINDINEIEDFENSRILIRAHGVPEKVFLDLRSKKIGKIIDRTCPKVKKIQKIVNNSYEIKKIIIIGDFKHPEIIGINGWCKFSAFIIKNLQEAKRLIIDNNLKNSKICLVVQTTFNIKKYLEIEKFFTNNFKDVEIHNTICQDTLNRQKEIIEKSKEFEMIIIFGSKESSNSNKLFEIASRYYEYSQLIETRDELDISDFNKVSKIFVCSSASTPKDLIFNREREIL